MKYVFLMLNLLKIRIVLSFEIMCSHDFGDKKYYCIISFLKSIVIAGRCCFFLITVVIIITLLDLLQ